MSKKTNLLAAADLPGVSFTVHVKGCARCTRDHDVKARRFEGEPIDGYNAWAPCPEYGDPILFRIDAANPKQTKETAKMPPIKKPVSEEERAVVEKMNKQAVADAGRFLDEGVKVGEEMRAGLMHVSEQMQDVLAGPLTREALLILLQPLCRKRANGDPMPHKDIESVLDALANLDKYTVTR